VPPMQVQCLSAYGSPVPAGRSSMSTGREPGGCYGVPYESSERGWGEISCPGHRASARSEARIVPSGLNRTNATCGPGVNFLHRSIPLVVLRVIPRFAHLFCPRPSQHPPKTDNIRRSPLVWHDEPKGEVVRCEDRTSSPMGQVKRAQVKVPFRCPG
jgi:hypothetical protein